MVTCMSVQLPSCIALQTNCVGDIVYNFVIVLFSLYLNCVQLTSVLCKKDTLRIRDKINS
jgi:hypothetical protein